MAVGSFFLSAAPNAQNSPELHFRFINFFIQPSPVGSLVQMYYDKETKHPKECTSFTSKEPSFLVLPDKSSFLQAKMASWT